MFPAGSNEIAKKFLFTGPTGHFFQLLVPGSRLDGKGVPKVFPPTDRRIPPSKFEEDAYCLESLHFFGKFPSSERGWE